ncbi:hypothetical protein [Microbulbifer sp.]|uniref:hypothetical protein n=1 Tax=Microbulbifer sp. TaxID=1908541 RepID=UPI003F3277A2
MYDELQELLGDLCVDYGFCLSTPFWEAMASKKRYTANEFVTDIFIADKTGPKDQEIYSPIIKKLFVEKFGTEVNVWNRRFQTARRKHPSRIEKDVVLLDFARTERIITNKNPRAGQLRARYKGIHMLKEAKSRKCFK